MLQPRLGWYAGDEASLPYDFDTVLGAIAPRPVLVYNPGNDRKNAAAEVAAMVSALQKGGYAALEIQTPAGAINEINAAARLAVLAAIQRWAA